MTDIVCLFNNMGLPLPPLCSKQKIHFLVGIPILSYKERELQKERTTTHSYDEVGTLLTPKTDRKFDKFLNFFQTP